MKPIAIVPSADSKDCPFLMESIWSYLLAPILLVAGMDYFRVWWARDSCRKLRHEPYTSALGSADISTDEFAAFYSKFTHL
jgi:hypothetical protein